jgi:[acyl-carrier-protein] S-malonyltransferase
MVKHRANEMQKACVLHPSSMAAVLGLSDEITENICNQAKEIVVPANYNSPGQIVISGSFEGIAEVTPLLQAAGAKRVLPLPVGGAFHSPLMKPALEVSDPEQIKENIIAQLTGPVKWSQSIAEMAKLGVTSYIEVGPGKVLQGLVKKIQPEAEIAGL